MEGGGINLRSSNEGSNVRYVPVESGMKKVDDGLVMEGKQKSNNMNKGKGISNVNGNSSKNVKSKNDINVKNSFEVLANDNPDKVDTGSDEWNKMRKKIDLACDLNMQIAESEKSRWSKDLVKYYNDKCNTKAKNNLMESLKWRVMGNGCFMSKFPESQAKLIAQILPKIVPGLGEK